MTKATLDLRPSASDEFELPAEDEEWVPFTVEDIVYEEPVRRIKDIEPALLETVLGNIRQGFHDVVGKFPAFVEPVEYDGMVTFYGGLRVWMDTDLWEKDPDPETVLTSAGSADYEGLFTILFEQRVGNRYAVLIDVFYRTDGLMPVAKIGTAPLPRWHWEYELITGERWLPHVDAK